MHDKVDVGDEEEGGAVQNDVGAGCRNPEEPGPVKSLEKTLKTGNRSKEGPG